MTLQPQFLPWMSDKKWEIPASFEGWMKPWGQGSAWPVAGPMAEVWDYWVDAGQRSVLLWDVLRKRGNQALEHMREGKPPVLIFDYEMVLDGRDFERPVNYALLRILPEPGMEIDPAKRPFVVVDPRAGHGPGIGGSKEESQIGVAMRAGHPCYFVTFFPEPMPGQTIEDVARTEAKFLEKVMALHPDSECKPCVIGNCQAGWAVAMLSAAAPEVTGPIVLAGSPLSYWAGVEGKNPMRYLGGLLGGTWLTSLSSDMGNGTFDGAHLVYNFENLNPANTFWSKQYNLYAKVDTEEERYLNFEKWWGGLFLMNAEEMDFIVNNLFVGNKLEDGRVVTTCGKRIDLRNIRAPIVVFASWGDNITPPQQALHWILDLYEDEDEIRANEQVIVYQLHEHVGHLGVFVSGKIAKKEYTETFGNMDIIDVLPPGLYEAVIEEKEPGEANVDLLPGDYTVTFEERTLDDIRALGEDPGGEELFNAVSRVSEINEGMYRTFVRPWVNLWMTDEMADALRKSHPLRVQHRVLSDENPAMLTVRQMAEAARQNRRPVAPDNPFWQLQETISNQIVQSLDLYRDMRDEFGEQLFRGVYNSPWLQAAMGLRSSQAERPKVRARDDAREALLEKRWETIKARADEGGFNEAVIRILLYTGKGKRRIDTRGLRYGEKIEAMRPPMSQREFKDAVRLQAALVQFDEELAGKSLQKLLPGQQERREALALVREVLSAAGPMDEYRAPRLREVEAFLGIDSEAVQPVEKATAAAEAALAPEVKAPAKPVARPARKATARPAKKPAKPKASAKPKTKPAAKAMPRPKRSATAAKPPAGPKASAAAKAEAGDD